MQLVLGYDFSSSASPTGIHTSVGKDSVIPLP